MKTQKTYQQKSVLAKIKACRNNSAPYKILSTAITAKQSSTQYKKIKMNSIWTNTYRHLFLYQQNCYIYDTDDEIPDEILTSTEIPDTNYTAGYRSLSGCFCQKGQASFVQFKKL